MLTQTRFAGSLLWNGQIPPWWSICQRGEYQRLYQYITMPARREWVTPSSYSKKNKVKFTKPASSAEPSRGNAPSSTSAKPTPPVPATNPFAVLGEKNSTSSGNPPEIQETAAGEPTPHVEDNSPPDHASAISTGPPNPSNLGDGEVESGDADIPDSIARALLDALQEMRQGN